MIKSLIFKKDRKANWKEKSYYTNGGMLYTNSVIRRIYLKPDLKILAAVVDTMPL